MNNSTIIIYILRVITGKIKLYFNIWKFRDNVLPLHSQNKVHWVFQHSWKGRPSTGFLEPNVTVKKWPTCIGICSFLFITVQNRTEKKMEQERKNVVPSFTTEGDRRAPSLCAAYTDMALESSAEVCSTLSTVQGKSLPRTVRTNGMSVTQPTSVSVSYLTALQFPNADI